MSNLFKRGSLVVLWLLVVAFGTQLGAQDGASRVIVPAADKATGAYSPAILANGTLYVSGQGGRNSDGSLATDFQQQVGQSLKNVQRVLHESGMDFGNVVWMNVYLTSSHNIDAMNDVYWKSIGTNPPARTVLVVGALPNGENVEINCIAVQNTSQRRSIWPQGWPQGQHVDNVLSLRPARGSDAASLAGILYSNTVDFDILSIGERPHHQNSPCRRDQYQYISYKYCSSHRYCANS